MGKRAPGGGRKPKGPVPARSQLTVRMPDDLRAELEAAAGHHGYNLTDEVIGRLRRSFAKERADRRDPAIRALTFLIAKLADNVHLGPVLEKQWHRDPFLFRSFKLAVAKLLDLIEPAREGELQSPVDEKRFGHLADRRQTPENAADEAFRILLWYLEAKVPLHERLELARKLKSDTDADFAVRDTGKAIEFRVTSDFYGMEHARRDLQIKLKKGS
jgi:hypothetical protein